MRILIIEDDIDLAETLQKSFAPYYTADICPNGVDGIYLAQISPYDLIIIDLKLPDLYGDEVCKNLRASGIDVPVIILTGDARLDSKLSCFNVGADDYLTKPFSFKELLSRTDALLRRIPKTTYVTTLSYRGLHLCKEERTLCVDNKTIGLRKKEYRLLEYLMRNAEQIVSRDRLFAAIWQKSELISSNSIDVLVNAVRKKLRKATKKKFIETIYGQGYRLKRSEDEPQAHCQ